MSRCPLCERPLSFAGAYLASADYAGRWFTFPICADCRVRQSRLPKQVRQRQDLTAANKVIKHPDRYDVQVWESSHEAKLYARLSADSARAQGVPATAGAGSTPPRHRELQGVAASSRATSARPPSLAASK